MSDNPDRSQDGAVEPQPSAPRSQPVRVKRVNPLAPANQSVDLFDRDGSPLGTVLAVDPLVYRNYPGARWKLADGTYHTVPWPDEDPRPQAESKLAVTVGTRPAADGDEDDTAGDVTVELPDIGRDLTNSERKLLPVLLNPTYFSKTPTEKAQLAGISKRSYHQVMSRPDFTALARYAATSALNEHVGEVLQALVDTAKQPGRDSHNDRRLFLSILRIHNEGRSQPNVNVNIGIGRRDGPMPHETGEAMMIVGVAFDEI